MTFEYGFGSTFAGVSSWTAPGGAFNFVSPVNNTTDGAVPGNTMGRISDLGGTISSVSWQDGATLWLRWIEREQSGSRSWPGDRRRFVYRRASGSAGGKRVCVRCVDAWDS